jgi:hypothetical protein
MVVGDLATSVFGVDEKPAFGSFVRKLLFDGRDTGRCGTLMFTSKGESCVCECM